MVKFLRIYLSYLLVLVVGAGFSLALPSPSIPIGSTVWNSGDNVQAVWSDAGTPKSSTLSGIKVQYMTGPDSPQIPLMTLADNLPNTATTLNFTVPSCKSLGYPPGKIYFLMFTDPKNPTVGLAWSTRFTVLEADNSDPPANYTPGTPWTFTIATPNNNHPTDGELSSSPTNKPSEQPKTTTTPQNKTSGVDNKFQNNNGKFLAVVVGFQEDLILISWLLIIIAIWQITVPYLALKKNFVTQDKYENLFIHIPFSLYHAWIFVIALLTTFALFTPYKPNDSDRDTPPVVLIFVILGLFLMEVAAILYIEKFNDVVGASIIAWTLFGIAVEQTD
ncbi:33918_t:CDS:2, partial [Gigaspora margarita]